MNRNGNEAESLAGNCFGVRRDNGNVERARNSTFPLRAFEGRLLNVNRKDSFMAPQIQAVTG